MVPWGNVTEQFTAAFAGGSPPDVFYLPDEWYPKYVSNDQIADLTDKISGWKENYTEAGWNGATYKGSTWGVPFLGVAQGWVCNMNLLKEKGLGLPTSWQEFRDAAKALHRCCGWHLWHCPDAGQVPTGFTIFRCWPMAAQTL